MRWVALTHWGAGLPILGSGENFRGTARNRSGVIGFDRFRIFAPIGPDKEETSVQNTGLVVQAARMETTQGQRRKNNEEERELCAL